MRIGLVIESLDAWRGGAETSTGQFINHLLGAGVELDLFTRSRQPSFPGCTIHAIRVSGRSRWRGTVGFLGRAALAAAEVGPDVLHAMVPCPTADIYEPRGGMVAETMERNVAVRKSRLGRAAKSALLWTSLRQRALLRAEDRLLRRNPPPTVVAISAYVARQVKTHYGLNADRVRVIFNGIDPDETTSEGRARNRREVRATFSIPGAAYVMVVVAHNFKLKGLACAIDALARLSAVGEADPILLIVGRGKPNRYKHQADRLGISNRVRFVGTTDRISAFYHAADVLVHPTFYDPCSRVVLEALAVGLPCITTRWNGAAEMMEDGKHGFVIDSPHDVASLTRAMNQLGDPAFRARCSRAAASLGPGITMRSHAEGILALYRELAGRE